MRKWLLLTLLLTSPGCQDHVSNQAASTIGGRATDESAPGPAGVDSNPLRNVYFGDTHVHTAFSMDAYLLGARATPDDAYIFAKGGAIEHASGLKMQMKKPLDFLAVTDHAGYLGMMAEIAKEDSAYSDHPIAPLLRDATDATGVQKAMKGLIEYADDSRRERLDEPEDSLDDRDVGWQEFIESAEHSNDPGNVPVIADDRDVAYSAWREIIESAERHNDPGNFTTFIAYEYTSAGPGSENLHRNVIFQSDKVPDRLFSQLDSLNPEDLWAWMDANREQGIESLAIPHNSNGSDGWMFQTTNWVGEKIDAQYAQTRMRNEPIVENTQVKGTSDTHPLLSPNDEWADFGIMPYRIASPKFSRASGSYVREAYLNGLIIESRVGVNPYKFGVIGSSDSHNAAGSFEEDNYWGKIALMDVDPHMRGSVPLPESDSDKPEYLTGAPNYWGASGLAGVWAESNTREDIYNAFRRKETFSTSGPRIKVRFFGSAGFDGSILDSADAIKLAYDAGVPMGGNLDRSSVAPSFFVWAIKDPDSAPLQRIQIIKGWLEEGVSKELVYDVACSDGGIVDPETHRCADNGASVDLATCTITRDKGDATLKGVWRDPGFDPAQRAFYYARILENPKCRWSTWDAIRAGVPPRKDMHAVIQDRAWSSPVWYNP